MRTLIAPLLLVTACDLGGQEDININIYLCEDTGMDAAEEEPADTGEPEEEKQQQTEAVAVSGGFSMTFVPSEGVWLESTCTGTYEGVVTPGEPLSLSTTCDSDVGITVAGIVVEDAPREVPISVEGTPRDDGWRTFLSSGYGGEVTGLTAVPCADEALDLKAEGGALVGEVSTDPGENEYDVSFYFFGELLEETAVGSCVVRFW